MSKKLLSMALILTISIKCAFPLRSVWAVEAQDPLPVPSSVGASTADVTAEAEKFACVADMKKFCADVPNEKGKKAQCLKLHQEQLSPGCKAKVEKIKKKQEAKRLEAEAKVKAGGKVVEEETKVIEVSEACKKVTPKDENFKECLKERLEIARGKWKKFHEKVATAKAEKIAADKVKAEAAKVKTGVAKGKPEVAKTNVAADKVMPPSSVVPASSGVPTKKPE